MKQGMTVQEMIKGLIRQRQWIAITFVATFVIGATVVLFLPNEYRATTIVRVEPHRPSPELVSSSVGQLLEENLRTIEYQLFSRQILEKAITKLQLLPEVRKEKGVAEAVKTLRAQLDVKVEGDSAYILTVTGSDPVESAKIANLLPKLLTEQASGIREKQAKATVELFKEELIRVEKQVKEVEKRITEFRQAHLGELPEQMESNMRSLDRIMVLLTARTDSQRELHRRELELDLSREALDSELGRLRRSELELSAALIDGRSQWTDGHPEMRRLKRELSSVRTKLKSVDHQNKEDNSQRKRVRGQLQDLNQSIVKLEKEAKIYRNRMDRAPQWIQQLADMDREYEVLRTKYQSLVSRKVEADIASVLEKKAKRTMFHVLSAAVPASEPYKPDREAGMLLAFLISAGAGALVGVFRELRDDSFHHVEQAKNMNVPVLASVPKASLVNKFDKKTL